MDRRSYCKIIMEMDDKKGNFDMGIMQECPANLVPAMEFFKRIPHTLQNCLKSRFKHSVKNELKFDSPKPLTWTETWERESLNASEVNLDKQLQAWKENPNWVDQPPKIEEVISRRVLVDEGQRQVVELEQAAIWRFLWWSGTISVHVFVDQNRKDHTVKFKQGKSGFMEKFEGCWKVEPLFVDEKDCFPHKPRTRADYDSCTKGKGRIGSTVTLDQLIQPALVPPPPISWYLRGITTKTTEMLITDLLAETARLRGAVSNGDSSRQVLEVSVDPTNVDCSSYSFDDNIKERWHQRRRRSRRQRNHIATAV